MGVGGVMGAAVRTGFGRIARRVLGGPAWVSGLAAGMMLVGAAVLLLVWSVEPPDPNAPTIVDTREVDLDPETGSTILTTEGAPAFGAPFRSLSPRVPATDEPPQRGVLAAHPASVPPSPPPTTDGGAGTQQPPATPDPADPAPTTGSGSDAGNDVVLSPPTPAPTPAPTPVPSAGGPPRPDGTGAYVIVSGNGTVVEVGAGVSGANATHATAVTVGAPGASASAPGHLDTHGKAAVHGNAPIRVR